MKSLKGKVIVVTRSKPGSKVWVNYLRKRGAKVYELPTITTGPLSPENSMELLKTLRRISNFDWIIFTSAAGPRSLKVFCKKHGVALLSAKMPKIAVIGAMTADAVLKEGGKVAFQSSKANSDTLGRALKSVRGLSILLLRASKASPELVTILKKRGAKVTDAAIYETRILKRPDPKFVALLRSDRIDFLTFASPSSVEGFFTRVPKDLIARAQGLPAIAIGSSVRLALKQAGFKKIIMAKKPSIEAIAAAMERHVLQ